jgi:hypothetical protein
VKGGRKKGGLRSEEGRRVADDNQLRREGCKAKREGGEATTNICTGREGGLRSDKGVRRSQVEGREAKATTRSCE